MSTPYLMLRRKYSSLEDGGGVHGKGIGTVPDTMTEGGVITAEYQVFTDIFMPVGEMISGIIGGEDNPGNIIGYITVIFMTIGVTGKEPGTGTLEDLVGTVVEDILPVGMEVEDPDLVIIPVEDILLVGTEVEDLEVIPAAAIPVEDTPVISVEVILAAAIPVIAVVEVIPVEENPVVADLANQVAVDLAKPVVVQLVSAEENPVYNLVPIIRVMKDYKKDRKEDEAAKRQTAA